MSARSATSKHACSSERPGASLRIGSAPNPLSSLGCRTLHAQMACACSVRLLQTAGWDPACCPPPSKTHYCRPCRRYTLRGNATLRLPNVLPNRSGYFRKLGTPQH
ncbi:unnamed protein product [Ixodes persulcatus]